MDQQTRNFTESVNPQQRSTRGCGSIATNGRSWRRALLAGLVGVLWQARWAELAHIIVDTKSAQTRIHEYATDLCAAWDAVERGLFADARRLLLKHQP